MRWRGGRLLHTQLRFVVLLLPQSAAARAAHLRRQHHTRQRDGLLQGAAGNGLTRRNGHDGRNLHGGGGERSDGVSSALAAAHGEGQEASSDQSGLWMEDA